MLLEGKKGLVMGIANERSIAWGIAHEAYKNGAKLCLTYQNELFKERIDKLASSINCDFILNCDVENQTSIKKLFNEISNAWEEIDFIVHAMAFSDKNELKGEFYNTTKENFNRTMLISSFSLTEISREAQHLMDKNGGSILTLSYIGGCLLYTSDAADE